MRKLVYLGATLALLISAPAAVAAEDAAAKRTWSGKCAVCHGQDGKAQTDRGKKMNIPDMSTKDWQKAHTDAQIAAALKPGYKVKAGGEEQDHVTSEMPQARIDGLVAIIRGLAAK